MFFKKIKKNLCFKIFPAPAIEYWSERLNLEEPNRLIGYMAKLIAKRADNLSLQQRNFLKSNIGDAITNHKYFFILIFF
jgi:hypothetical protein